MKPPKITYLLVLLFSSVAVAAFADVGDLRITEVNPATGEVEVTNFSTDAFTTTSSLPFLHRLDATSSIPNATSFAAGESKVFTVGGLNATDSDLWLYRDTNYESSDSIIAGLKYGPEPDVGRVDVAVAAGIWPSTSAFVPAPSPGESLQLVAFDPTKPERWGSAAPRLATFFGDGTEIVNPLPGIQKGATVIELQTIAEGLVSPLGMAALDDGTGRLFIYDQTGQVLIWQSGNILPTPFLDVSSRLVTLNPGYDERGLLGIALHPDFATNGKLYTYTSEPATGTPDFPSPGGVRNHQSVVAEWTVDAQNPNVVDVSSRREMLRIDGPQGNHNAGEMHFGPDGKLYIALGDGGAADDEGAGHSPQGNAQDITNALGSIFRIDVEGNNSANGQYGVPPDNPFVAKTGVDEIFAYGFRNPYRFSFDRSIGSLYVGDVGQNDVEEVNIVTNGGNYGWRLKEGSFFFEPDGGFPTTLPVVPIPPGVVDPIAEYDH
jgi:glucose/arabinose dehydrogenase